jgi:hypothetical protein
VSDAEIIYKRRDNANGSHDNGNGNGNGSLVDYDPFTAEQQDITGRFDWGNILIRGRGEGRK